MARNKNTNTQAQNAPEYPAWHVTEKGEKSYWNKVGAVWSHKDDKGLQRLIGSGSSCSSSKGTKHRRTIFGSMTNGTRPMRPRHVLMLQHPSQGCFQASYEAIHRRRTILPGYGLRVLCAHALHPDLPALQR